MKNNNCDYTAYISKPKYQISKVKKKIKCKIILKIYLYWENLSCNKIKAVEIIQTKQKIAKV